MTSELKDIAGGSDTSLADMGILEIAQLIQQPSPPKRKPPPNMALPSSGNPHVTKLARQQLDPTDSSIDAEKCIVYRVSYILYRILFFM